MFSECENDWRRNESALYVMVLRELQELLEIETRHGDNFAALRERIVHQNLHAVNMEERQERQHGFALIHCQHGSGLDEVGDQITVSQHHALRQACSARRVGQRHHVVR